MKNKIEQSKKHIMWKYLCLMKKHLPLYLGAIFVMTIAAALFDVVGSMLIKSVFDIAQSGEQGRIVSEISLDILLGVAASVLMACATNVYNNEAKRGALQVKKLVFAKSMRLPMSYYDTHHSGEMLSRFVYDTDKASGIYTSRLRRVVAPILSVLVYVVAMMALSPVMTVCLILVNMLLFLVNTTMSGPMKRIGQEMSHKNALMTEKLSNIIAGIETSKMYDTKGMTTREYIAANEDFVKTQKRRMKLAGILESFNVGFDLLCALMFLVIGVIFIRRNMATIGEVLAIYTMYGALSFRFLQLGKYYPELMNCVAYAERTFAFLKEAEEPELLESILEEEKAEPFETADLQQTGPAIEIDNITFQYDNNHKVLDGTSFTIPTGKNVALTGESGCGKSTIAKLMLGFYPYASGDIRFFGKSMKELGLSGVRRQIAYVPQEPYLYEVSILENIRYGRLEASDEEVIAAAKLANADEFIRRQLKGYDTQVSNHGQSLSGGERQRIAIARAILKNAPIMLFDEATSALDNESEQLIQDAVNRLKQQKTIVTIAHRTATIEMADMQIGM